MKVKLSEQDTPLLIWERSHDVLSGSWGLAGFEGGGDGGHEKNVALKGGKGGKKT